MRPAVQSDSWRGKLNPGVVAGVVIAALGLLVLVAVAPFIPGLLGAPVLSVLFAPLHKRLARRMRPGLAVAIVIALAIVLVLLPGLALVGLLVREVPAVLGSADIAGTLSRLSRLEIRGIRVGADLATMGNAVFTWASHQILVIVGSATRMAINLVIAFFGFYYLLVSDDSAWREFSNYSPFSRATTERLRTKFRNLTWATMAGIGLGSAAQALIVGTGFAITGLPDPILWGAVTAVVAVLPMLGASLVWGGGVIALLVEHRFGAALALALMGSVISAHTDDFIRPMVSRRVARIHPVVTLVGVFAGVTYIGVAGLLLGPLALAWFFELVRAFELEFLPRTPAAPNATD